MCLCTLGVGHYVEGASPIGGGCVWGESIPTVIRCMEGKVKGGKAENHRVVEPGLVRTCNSG